MSQRVSVFVEAWEMHFSSECRWEVALIGPSFLSSLQFFLHGGACWRQAKVQPTRDYVVHLSAALPWLLLFRRGETLEWVSRALILPRVWIFPLLEQLFFWGGGLLAIPGWTDLWPGNAGSGELKLDYRSQTGFMLLCAKWISAIKFHYFCLSLTCYTFTSFDEPESAPPSVTADRLDKESVVANLIILISHNISSVTQ